MLIGGGSALTMAQLEDIQASCLADDIQIDFNRMSLWDECTVRAFFESGGEMVVAAVADTAAAAAPSTAAAAAAASTASAAVVAAAEPSGRALRWAVDISTWDPTPAQWTLLLGLLTEEVRTHCLLPGQPAAEMTPVTAARWPLACRKAPRRCASSFVMTRRGRL